MTFDEVLAQVQELLQREKRVSYRGLKRRFALDDDYLEDLKEELIYAKRLAVDEDGKVLVWIGEGQVTAVRTLTPLTPQSPASYTPPHLAERIRAEQAALEARGGTDGERKTITALFADVAGFTALAHDLDPEETRRIIDPALQLMMDAVHRYEGYVAQSLGDGIFALFGAPLAHEDHPQRALYAALRMQEEMTRYADRLRLEKGVPLQMRVGINTGEVVLRSIRKDDLHTDYVPVGDSTNLASRMESLATPGSIVVSEATYRLIEGYFMCKPLGAAQGKGNQDASQYLRSPWHGPPAHEAPSRGQARAGALCGTAKRDGALAGGVERDQSGTRTDRWRNGGARRRQITPVLRIQTPRPDRLPRARSLLGLPRESVTISTGDRITEAVLRHHGGR